MRTFPSSCTASWPPVATTLWHFLPLQFHQEMWHFATGCMPKETALRTSRAAFSMQIIEPSMSKQDRIQGERTTPMASLSLLDVTVFARYTEQEKGEKQSLWCSSLSSFNEEVSSNKTAAASGPRPPRLTISPQLPVLCRVLKSSSTCWLLLRLLLNGGISSRLDDGSGPHLLSR